MKVTDRARADRVPVDERWLGLDRRSRTPALVVLLVAVLFTGVLPAVNGAIDQDDLTVAGDVLVVGPGGMITPPVGWQVESGLRATDDPAAPSAPPVVLSRDGVTVVLTTVATPDSPGTVLDRYEDISDLTDDIPDFTVNGPRAGFTTDSGVAGAVESVSGADVEGLAAAFTLGDGAVVVATATGAAGQLAPVLDDVRAMLRSLRLDGEAS